VVVLIRQRRVGLLVDAAIAGFAVGTGFALIENLYYLAERSEALLFVQVIRGFGTAIMHGGATATFATVSIAMQERRPAIGPIMFLPAFIAAAVLHSTFNHLLVQPVLATLTMAVVLPVVFRLRVPLQRTRAARLDGGGLGRENGYVAGHSLGLVPRLAGGPVFADLA